MQVGRLCRNVTGQGSPVRILLEDVDLASGMHEGQEQSELPLTVIDDDGRAWSAAAVDPSAEGAARRLRRRHRQPPGPRIRP